MTDVYKAPASVGAFHMRSGRFPELVTRMYGPPRDCKGKFGREDRSAQMYSAFRWRLVLLARMSCARVCPYKRRYDGFFRPRYLCRLRGRTRRRGAGKWEGVSASEPEGVFSAFRLAPLRACNRCRWTAQPRRYGRSCWPWRLPRRSCELWRPAGQATRRWELCPA